MAVQTFNLTYHYWGWGIKPYDVDHPVKPLIMTPGTAFEGKPEFDSNMWEAHTGTDTTEIEEDRTTADTKPNFEQQMLLEEGLADALYMMFGSYDTPVPVVNGATIAKRFHIFRNGLIPQPEPLCTLVNGYAKTNNDAYVYDNCMLNELELTIDEKGCSSKLTFASAAPIIGQPNPARTRANNLTRLLYGKTKIYLADLDEDNLLDSYIAEEDISSNELACFIKHSFKFGNDTKANPCHGGSPEKQKPVAGKKEDTGSTQILWNENSKKLLHEWYTGYPDGNIPNYVPCYKQILVVIEGKEIEKVSSESVKSQAVFYIPRLQLTNVDPELSGDEEKTLTLESKVTTDGNINPIESIIDCALQDLHISTEELTIVSNH